MPIDRTVPTPGRSLVSRRAVIDIVRGATIGSYGVVGFVRGGPWSRLREGLGGPPRGLRVQLDDGITIEIDLVVAHNVPVAEVARQVDSAIRYAVRHALERDVDRLLIHVAGLRVASGGGPDVEGRSRPARRLVTPDDLAGSGTDVA